VSEKRTGHRATPPTAASSPTAPPDRPRVIRRDTVQRARAPGASRDGERRAPSAAKRGGKPWAMTPAELSAAIDVLAGGNQSRFARVCGVHDRTVRSWLVGKPAIPKAIQVLVAALRRLDAAAREEIVREAGAIE
jgi:hypothetical protein